ncbi:DUF2243 domain-containing protein [Roseomonas sp. CCTCC AB2023176]|uniref:DUF2243 domain-containing protein n=1 Tax=Roseomonas sp. CCTCC AB2023176 TaxID=3342640 RepID=UPI0035E280EB
MIQDGMRPTGGLLLAGGVIGFALGGFFDGILLHQVLQWHHFLSLVQGAALRQIGNQILADGLFHVAVYAIAAVGLVLLWRARGGFAAGARTGGWSARRCWASRRGRSRTSWSSTGSSASTASAWTCRTRWPGTSGGS